jgi:hypothetical protein
MNYPDNVKKKQTKGCKNREGDRYFTDTYDNPCN